MAAQRLNWPLISVVTVIGLGAILGGIQLGGWNTDTFSGVFVEVGAAIGLASALVIVERRVLREAAVSTAKAEAERVTEELRTRVDRLEDLDDAQRETREKQRRAFDEQLAAIRGGEITSTSIGRVVVDAIRDQLIDAEQFCVRTSPDADCAVLYALPFIQPSGDVIALFLDFEPMRLAAQPFMVDNEPVPVPEKTESTVMWRSEDASGIGAQLQAGLERRNIPADGFGFGYAVDRLLDGIEVMRHARSAPSASPERIQGRLRMLINDDWLYTSSGLEAVSANVVIPLEHAGFEVGELHSGPVGAHMFMSSQERERADILLAEALNWVETRESVQILEPGTDPNVALFPQSGKS